MTPEEFEIEWERVSPWFERALGYSPGMWTLDEIKTEIVEGRAQFWQNEEAAAVTNFFHSPRVKALWLWLLGGSSNGLRTLIPQAEMWGIEQGCTMFMGEGRKGFERITRPYGYRPTATLYVKDLMYGPMQ